VDILDEILVDAFVGSDCKRELLDDCPLPVCEPAVGRVVEFAVEGGSAHHEESDFLGGD